MGNKGRGEKTKMNKGRREGQGERANNNKEFSYVFVWCLFRSLIGPKSGQNPKKKKHPNLQPHCVVRVVLKIDLKMARLALFFAAALLLLGVYVGFSTVEKLPPSLEGKEIHIVKNHELVEKYFEPFERVIGDDMPGKKNR